MLAEHRPWIDIGRADRSRDLTERLRGLLGAEARIDVYVTAPDDPLLDPGPYSKPLIDADQPTSEAWGSSDDAPTRDVVSTAADPIADQRAPVVNELEQFIASLSLMTDDEAARVQAMGIASGAHASRRWAEIVAAVIVAAKEHHLDAAREAAQRWASLASAASPGRSGHRYLVADYCAGVWAEVLVLREHLPPGISRVALSRGRTCSSSPIGSD